MQTLFPDELSLSFSHMRLATTIEQAARAAVEASKQAEVIVQAAVSSGGNISPTSVQGLRKRYVQMVLCASLYLLHLLHCKPETVDYDSNAFL